MERLFALGPVHRQGTCHLTPLCFGGLVPEPPFFSDIMPSVSACETGICRDLSHAIKSSSITPHRRADKRITGGPLPDFCRRQKVGSLTLIMVLVSFILALAWFFAFQKSSFHLPRYHWHISCTRWQAFNVVNRLRICFVGFGARSQLSYEISLPMCSAHVCKASRRRARYTARL